jgi:hypothetical protein
MTDIHAPARGILLAAALGLVLWVVAGLLLVAVL